MNRKLSIGIIGTRGIPNQYGGYEAAIQELAPRLVSKGHNVVVYCSSLQNTKVSNWQGVELVYRYDPENLLGSFGQFIYDLNCNIASRKYKHDVIFHMGYTSDSLWYWAWDKAAEHITNMDGLEWMRSKYSPKVRKFLKRAERWAAIHSKLLIADSTGIMDYIKENYSDNVKHIAYGVEIPNDFKEDHLKEYEVIPNEYELLIARMVPENNIELAIEAKIRSGNEYPLVIFGNENRYAKELKFKYGENKLIRFHNANYDKDILNSLRYFSRYYIHGHSVGGTNPSLLEAMAAQCRIFAHHNVFNRGVLENGGEYFNSTNQLVELFRREPNNVITDNQIKQNISLLRYKYDWDIICNMYEDAALQL